MNSKSLILGCAVLTMLVANFLPVYALECDPLNTGKTSESDCAANCLKDCIRITVLGQPDTWCCPKGCVGEPCQPGKICFINPLSSCTFEDLIESVMSFILTVGIAISVLMTVVAGYYFLTSGGDPKKYKKAIDIIKYVFIGVCILLLAKGIVFTIKWIVGA